MKIRLLLFIVLCSFGSKAACAQEEDSTASATDSVLIFSHRGGAGAGADGGPRHILKLNLMAAAAKNISMQYEQGVGRKTSVALGLRLMPHGALPFHTLLQDQVLPDAEKENPAATSHFLNNARASGWAVTPEFRYYLGAGRAHGFYLAPFARYAQIKLDWDYSFIDNGTPRRVQTDATLKLSGGGLMVGAQWHFGPVALDWWIMGASYNAAELRVNAQTDYSYKTDAELKDEETIIESIRLNGKGVDATVSKNGVAVTGRAGVPLLRFGLCLGYSF